MPAYSTTPPARVLEKEPVRVPSLAMPRLEIDRNGSIKLILPFHGEESLARKLSDGIYYLFFYDPIPSYFSFRHPRKNGLDNLYVRDDYRKKVDAMIDFLNGLIELIGACGISSQHFIATLQLIYDEPKKGDGEWVGSRARREKRRRCCRKQSQNRPAGQRSLV